MGKVQIGDWLISVDGVKLQSLTTTEHPAEYLRKKSDARKVFQIKRTASFPLLSEFYVLAHAAEEVKQTSFTRPVRSEDRNRNCVLNKDFIKKKTTNFRMNVAHSANIDFTSGEEMVKELCQPMETREHHDSLEYAQSETRDNFHVSEEQALHPSIEVDISNCLSGVQAAAPVPPSIKTGQRKGKKKISFDQRIEELKRFKEKHGHCDLNKSSKGNASLGVWSDHMRYTYRGKGTGKRTEYRIRRLEAIGFKWILLKAKTKNTAVVDHDGTSNSREHIISTSDCSCDMHSDLDDSKAEWPVEVPLEHAVNPNCWRLGWVIGWIIRETYAAGKRTILIDRIPMGLHSICIW